MVLTVLCSVGAAGSCAGDGPSFVARLPQGTVELVGVTNSFRPTTDSRWWRPDGSAASIGRFRAVQKYHFPRLFGDDKVRTLLGRFENLPSDASTDPVCGIDLLTTPRGPVWVRRAQLGRR